MPYRWYPGHALGYMLSCINFILGLNGVTYDVITMYVLNFAPFERTQQRTSCFSARNPDQVSPKFRHSAHKLSHKGDYPSDLVHVIRTRQTRFVPQSCINQIRRVQIPNMRYWTSDFWQYIKHQVLTSSQCLAATI